MKKALITLSVIFVLLLIAAVMLHTLPASDTQEHPKKMSFGISEGRQLVACVNSRGDTIYTVEDEYGDKLFDMPVQNCILASAYHNGKLAFRNAVTGRTGYIDAKGNTFFDGKDAATPVPTGDNTTVTFTDGAPAPQPSPANGKQNKEKGEALSINSQRDLRQIARSNPFYGEASKVLSGRLEEKDAAQRRVILNYCEHFRTAYTTKDIDFLNQIFSDKALIIVGNIVKTWTGSDAAVDAADEKVTYSLRTKKEYLQRLNAAFAANKKIDVKFSGFKIMRHPTQKGLYGVTLRQKFKTDRYTDDGYIFLLWDFRNPSMPLIHVRTWQPSAGVNDADDIIGIQDFNLE